MMSWVEIVAVFFYIISIILTIRKNIWFWPIGIIADVFYLQIFYHEKLYADTVMQVIFLIQSFYGWYFWLNKKREVNITFLSTFGKWTTITGVLLGTVITYLILQKYTDASSPFWDALGSSLSIAASWLLARRIIENWMLWVLADLIYVGLFVYKGLYLSSGIYLVFVVLSVAGFMQWRKEFLMKKNSTAGK